MLKKTSTFGQSLHVRCSTHKLWSSLPENKITSTSNTRSIMRTSQFSLIVLGLHPRRKTCKDCRMSHDPLSSTAFFEDILLLPSRWKTTKDCRMSAFQVCFLKLLCSIRYIPQISLLDFLFGFRPCTTISETTAVIPPTSLCINFSRATPL